MQMVFGLYRNLHQAAMCVRRHTHTDLSSGTSKILSLKPFAAFKASPVPSGSDDLRTSSGRRFTLPTDENSLEERSASRCRRVSTPSSPARIRGWPAYLV